MNYCRQSREALKLLDNNCSAFPALIPPTSAALTVNGLNYSQCVHGITVREEIRSAVKDISQKRAYCKKNLQKSSKSGRSSAEFANCNQRVQVEAADVKPSATSALNCNKFGKLVSADYVNFSPVDTGISPSLNFDTAKHTVSSAILSGKSPQGLDNSHYKSENNRDENALNRKFSRRRGSDAVNLTKLRDQACKFQSGVTVGYTYDALFVSDGRSKRLRLDENQASSTDVTLTQNEKLCIKPEYAVVCATAAESSGQEACATMSALLPAVEQQHTDVEAKAQAQSQAQRYTCNICQKNYATSSNLSRHKQTHRSLDSAYAKKCPDCGKAYVSMPALSMHLLTHKLEHKCEVCGKAFSRPWLLQGHMRSHSGSKNLCKICVVFHLLSDERKQNCSRLVHPEPTPYGCLHCGKAFADRSNLRAHMQTHSNLKKYGCTKCGKKFALKTT